VAPDDGGSPETIVEVRDNGIGGPADKRTELFSRFFRAHEDSKGEIEGTGLGLSIVRETATALGGRAWAAFHDDGTTFFFTMPHRRAEDDAADVETSRVTVPEATGSVGRTAEGSVR
jgi:two-component system sensor histidine kinase VicK